MNNDKLKEQIENMVPGIEFPENKQYLEAIIPSDKIHDVCSKLKTADDTSFDYLFCLTVVDWTKFFIVVYHLTSSKFNHSIVLKTKVEDRNNPQVDTVSDIWATAEFHEREMFDLFGIQFKKHPDLRRLFLDDHWVGYPLRKDYVDEINIIER